MQTILIIDDDPAGTKLLSTLLTLEGYQPLSLEDWANPLDDVERHRPDLVIMDIYLRTKDGLDLLSELRDRDDPELAQTPVLMMSAEDQRIRCRQVGANAFLEKPFNIHDLLNAIREIEEGGRETLSQ